MRLSELKARLIQLKDEGFVEAQRRGPTGVGYTLEQRLELSENNLPIPDIGGRVEVKATRVSTNNLITLFSLNRRAWKRPYTDVIERYGYRDAKGRTALYATVTATGVNPQGLKLNVDRTSNTVEIVHGESGEVLAEWDLFYVVGKFVTKFERMLFVKAESRKDAGRPEEFHYVEASLLTDPGTSNFLDGFANGDALIDVRMHINEHGGARNHGTAFRVREQSLPSLFGNELRLV